MKKAQILAITGITAGVVGSATGAIMTRKMYKKSKCLIESGELNDKNKIKGEKLKTGLAVVGTTLLAGLAIASGVGLAMSYSKDENYGEVKYFNNPDEKLDNEEWLTAMSEQSGLVDELILNSMEQTEGLMTIKDEVDEFVSIMGADKIERIHDILDDTETSIDRAYDEMDNAIRNVDVVQGIIEENM